MIEKYKFYSTVFFIVFWVTACYGFVSEELLGFLMKVRSHAFVAGDAVFIILGLITIRDRKDLLVAGTFFVIALVSTIFINHEGFGNMANGMRDFVGLLFAIPVFRYFITSKNGSRFVKSFDKQLIIFLCLQAVCLVWQFLKYGANDHGGGTLGNGGSGTISMIIYTLSFYLVSKRWDTDKSYISNLLDNKWFVVLLFPTFLNETKISFILFLMYFVLLAPINWKTVKRIFLFSPLIFVGLLLLGWAYFAATNQDPEDFTGEYFQEYFLGLDPEEIVEVALKLQDEEIEVDPDEWWTVDIPRFMKLFELPDALADARGGMTIGAGLGQFKGGTLLNQTNFGKKYKWLTNGSRPWSFFMLLQLGFIGLVWFGWMTVVILDFRHQHRDSDKNIKIFILLDIILMLFYNDSLRVLPLCIVLFYITAMTYMAPPVRKRLNVMEI